MITSNLLAAASCWTDSSCDPARQISRPVGLPAFVCFAVCHRPCQKRFHSWSWSWRCISPLSTCVELHHLLAAARTIGDAHEPRSAVRAEQCEHGTLPVAALG